SGKLTEFINSFYSQHPDFMNFIYENSLIGTMSADLKFVYMIDDIGIPVPPSQIASVFGINPGIGFQPPPPFNSDVKTKIFQNSLQAYDLQTGGIKWSLGASDNRKHGDMEDSHFLGAPLPVAGKLYALNEKVNGELRLIIIDPATQPYGTI